MRSDRAWIQETSHSGSRGPAGPGGSLPPQTDQVPTVPTEFDQWVRSGPGLCAHYVAPAILGSKFHFISRRVEKFVDRDPGQLHYLPARCSWRSKVTNGPACQGSFLRSGFEARRSFFFYAIAMIARPREGARWRPAAPGNSSSSSF